MLLIPTIQSNGDLSLDIYSSDTNEINAVGQFLLKSRIQYLYQRLGEDEAGRSAIAFIIMEDDIVKLEEAAGLKFSGVLENTEVTFNSGDIGENYKCIRTRGRNDEFQMISADDQEAAMVKCGLMAYMQSWFGSTPEPDSK